MREERPQPDEAPRVMKVNLWLRVENNNKHIRGKTKARDEIEQWVLSRYQMTKDHPDGWEYELSISYQTDEELDAIIYDDILADAELDAIIYDDILADAERIADRRHCFIEADVSAIDDPDRSW